MIAMRGIDISVGAVVAISAAVAAWMIGGSVDGATTRLPLGVAVIGALAVAMLCGLWNGALVAGIVALFEASHPQHPYVIEPQSRQYLAHGDLWDHAYDKTPAGHVFLPMTLELGSWLWIRKNPRQLFSRHGMFNPIKAHRIKRVLRRHADLLDFLTRAAYAAPGWLPGGERRAQLMR